MEQIFKVLFHYWTKNFVIFELNYITVIVIDLIVNTALLKKPILIHYLSNSNLLLEDSIILPLH